MQKMIKSHMSMIFLSNLYYSCFAPSSTAKHPLLLRNIVQHLLERPDQGHTTEGYIEEKNKPSIRQESNQQPQ